MDRAVIALERDRSLKQALVLPAEASVSVSARSKRVYAALHCNIAYLKKERP